jgi:hypothetical protein
MDGPGPSEAIVEIITIRGREEVIVDVDSLRERALDVGPYITEKNGNFLIELPRETVSGQTRVWIPQTEMIRELT